MAEIIAKFDTITKKLVVTQDGKAIDNVCYVSCGQKFNYSEGEMEEDEYCLNISTCVEDEGTDIKTYTSLTASEKGDLVERDIAESKIDSKVISDISDYFTK